MSKQIMTLDKLPENDLTVSLIGNNLQRQIHTEVSHRLGIIMRSQCFIMKDFDIKGDA